MSDTPKTLQEECYGTCWAACERIEELESQLRAASNRIKRLEEVGDAVAAIIGPPGSAHWADENQVDAAWTNWTKAKEDKL